MRTISKGNLDDDAVIALLAEHLESMHATSPPGSVHALDVNELRAASVTFWCAYEEGDLLGCGALKELDTTAGEIKSMRTARPHLGRGVGKAMLDHIIDAARHRGYSHLYLETGSTPDFQPALRLYEKSGFAYCDPFADYTQDPFSRFMVLML